MNAKILFFDDIFSPLFRKQFPADQLIWDDNWIASLEQGLGDSEAKTGVGFELIKTGDIDSCLELTEKEKPDLVLLDLFWPEDAKRKYGDRSRATDISIDSVKSIRKSFPDIPIICYTIQPDRELMENVYAAGATIFLEKVTMALQEIQGPLKYILFYLLRQKGKTK
jgi:DNA-binding NarL/FixJ family response regulator